MPSTSRHHTTTAMRSSVLLWWADVYGGQNRLRDVVGRAVGVPRYKRRPLPRGGLETRDVNTLNSSEASQRQTASSAMSRPCCGPEVVPPFARNMRGRSTSSPIGHRYHLLSENGVGLHESGSTQMRVISPLEPRPSIASGGVRTPKSVARWSQRALSCIVMALILSSVGSSWPQIARRIANL